MIVCVVLIKIMFVKLLMMSMVVRFVVVDGFVVFFNRSTFTLFYVVFLIFIVCLIFIFSV